MSNKKTKFPKDRSKQSKVVKENRMVMTIFSSLPRTEITIDADLSENAQHDIRMAIDEVLKFHGL